MRREDLSIETPCQQDWSGMKPADMKKRFCDECRMHVHDLAAMTKREAEDVLASGRAEGLCIRYLYDQHGDVVFADDPRLVAPSTLVRAPARPLAGRSRGFALGAMAIALPMSLTACMGGARVPAPLPPPPPAAVASLVAPIATSMTDADAGVAPAPLPIAK
jgi:hypothetical protein